VTTILAVSPHLDDAVFSAGALLRRLARRGCRVVVATVFTGNVAQPEGFALACQIDKGLAADIDYMALRRAEDEAACRLLGLEVRHLPLLEAPHRGYHSAPDLFAGVRDDDGIGGAVSDSLSALVAELRPSAVLGPLGIGNHADHLVVREALERLDPARLFWWEDWPYAVRQSDRLDRRGMRSLPLSAEARRAKAAACASYASQVGFQFGGEAGLHDLLAGQQCEYYRPATVT